MNNLVRALSLLISIAAGIGLIALATGRGAYGWLLFLAVPFVIGFLAVIVYSWNRPRTLRQCLWVSLWPFFGICVLLLALKMEGLYCIAMAAPLAIPLGLIGGYMGWLATRNRGAVAIGSCLILLMPTGIVLGPHGPRPQTFTVTTSIVVNAPPEIVWRRVTDFPAIVSPPELMFRGGVAFPIESDIDGAGVGATRRCVLSTGVLNETVTAWNPPFLLRFRVNSTPPAMHELSPWPDIDPPHLHGFYEAQQGQFNLTELPGHRTLVEGTSWYSHGLEPAQYWRLWSDYVVHRVHTRVLRTHQDARGGRSTSSA